MPASFRAILPEQLQHARALHSKFIPTTIRQMNS